MIRLEEVTPENWRYDLKVAESQKNYVSDSMRLGRRIRDCAESDKSELNKIAAPQPGQAIAQRFCSIPVYQ